MAKQRKTRQSAIPLDATTQNANWLRELDAAPTFPPSTGDQASQHEEVDWSDVDEQAAAIAWQRVARSSSAASASSASSGKAAFQRRLSRGVGRPGLLK